VAQNRRKRLENWKMGGKPYERGLAKVWGADYSPASFDEMPSGRRAEMTRGRPPPHKNRLILWQ
jgi:hypothetical protein